MFASLAGNIPALEQLITSTTRHLQAVPPELQENLEKVQTTPAHLESQQGRHLSRILEDLRREEAKLRARVEKIRDGSVANAYRQSADALFPAGSRCVYVWLRQYQT